MGGELLPGERRLTPKGEMRAAGKGLYRLEYLQELTRHPHFWAVGRCNVKDSYSKMSSLSMLSFLLQKSLRPFTSELLPI